MHHTRHATKEAARHQFERWAPSYDRSILQRVVFQPSYRAFLTEVVRWRLADPAPFDALDVGCGTGTWCGMLANAALPARRVVGLDYSHTMCRHAAEKTRRGEGQPLPFIHGDAEHLPFTDHSFDLLTCSNSFHHYPHQAAVVREFHRVLRPGGRLMIIDGFRDNLIGWIAFDVFVTRAEGRVYHAPASVMRQYFREAGFRTISQRKFGVLVPLFVTVGAV
ncbi:MAG: methyltransferase domain-containing protein [Phycisphaerae bacterium]